MLQHTLSHMRQDAPTATLAKGSAHSLLSEQGSSGVAANTSISCSHLCNYTALTHLLAVAVAESGVAVSCVTVSCVVVLSRRLEFDDVFLVDFFSDSPVTSGWRVLLQLLAEYEEVVEAIARFAAALQADRLASEAPDAAAAAAAAHPPKTWQELASSMTAGEMRKLVASARHERLPNPSTQKLRDYAVEVAGRSEMLKTLPSSARLLAVPLRSDEQAGWLRPLEFDPQAHRWAGWRGVGDGDLGAAQPVTASYHWLRKEDLQHHLGSSQASAIIPTSQPFDNGT